MDRIGAKNARQWEFSFCSTKLITSQLKPQKLTRQIKLTTKFLKVRVNFMEYDKVNDIP